MKALLCLLLACSLLNATSGQLSEVEVHTKRMDQIEKKFGVKILYQMQDDEKNDYWLFQLATPDRFFHCLPIVVRKNASDSEFVSARLNAVNCAIFYEKCFGLLIQERKSAEPEPTPSPTPAVETRT